MAPTTNASRNASNSGDLAVNNLRLLNARLIGQIADLRRKIDALNASNCLMDSNLSEIMRETDKMKVEVEEVNIGLMKELERLEEEVSGFMENGKIAALVEELKVEKNTLISEVRTEFQKDKRRVMEQINGLQEKVGSFSAENGMMYRQIVDLNEKLEISVRQNQTLLSMMKKVEEEKVEIENELQRVRDQLQDLVEERATVDSRLAEMEIDKAKALQTSLKKKAEVEGELERVRTEMQALMREKAVVESRLAEMNEVEEAKTEFEGELQISRSTEMDALVREKTMMISRLAEMENGIANAERNLEEKTKSLNEMKIIIDECEEVNQAQKMEISELLEETKIHKKCFWGVLSAAVAFGIIFTCSKLNTHSNAFPKAQNKTRQTKTKRP